MNQADHRESEKILIIIPARYASSRLPGKPLIKIAGIEMLKRVAAIAKYVAEKIPLCSYIVATDDERISFFCKANDIDVCMTSPGCSSGTERCYDAVKGLAEKPGLIINLQGDNPLCPPWFLEDIISAWKIDHTGKVFTPFVQLNRKELDDFYEMKKITPFSGTTVQVDKSGYALTFSKLALPAIRNTYFSKNIDSKSPLRRHIGLYAYTYDGLEKYFQLEAGEYEEAEGLEQMRFIEHRVPVKMVEVDYRGRQGMSGVDSEKDISRAEDIITKYGEFNFKL